MKLILKVVLLCVAIVGPNSGAFAQENALGNADVISLTKAGIDKTVIIAKIRASDTKFDLSTAGLIELKNAGVADEVVAAMFTPKSESGSSDGKPKRVKDELGSLFPRLKNSVFTIWSELGGHGSGFLISSDGLILTNFHVVGPSERAWIQFDENRKVEAKVLIADSGKDIAVLWANLDPFPDAIVAEPLALGNASVVEEGERVLAIGSPLNQRKIMTTGVISKVEERVIISDVNINHGNSGGPLFNSLGEVIGINTFGDSPTYLAGQIGPGLSGIVRIGQAFPLVEEARLKIGKEDRPSGRLFPVEPKGEFPLVAFKDIASAKKFDMDPYLFEVGKFTMTLITPVLKYRMATETEREAMKGRKGREKNTEIKGTFNPFQGLHGWAEYLGEYRPVLHIQAIPEIQETKGSFWTRALVGGLTGVMPAGGNFKFKADFYRMKLFCGEKEVEPIQPSKVAKLFNEKQYFTTLKDATYYGIYTYAADAINDGCGTVRVEIYSAQKPNEAQIEKLKPKHIAKLASDFKPYFDMRKETVIP